MNWSDKYTGIPYQDESSSFGGCDCWGLVRLVYQNELGIELPDYGRRPLESAVAYLRRAKRLIEQESFRWPRAVSPQPFDVVLVRNGKCFHHMGVVSKLGYFLHCDEDIDSRVERCDAPIWKHRIAGFYRHD